MVHMQEKRMLAMRDQPDLSSVQDVITFSISWRPAWLKWSDLARLGYSRFFMVSSFLRPLLFSIGCNNGKMMTMTKTMVQLQFGGEPCILLQSTCTTTYQVTTCLKQSIWSHKPAASSGKAFEEIIFVFEVKFMRTAKFIVLETKFPAIR